MAEVAGLILAGPPLVALIVDAIKKTQQTLKTYRDAHEKYQGQLLRIDAHLFEVEQLITFSSTDGLNETSRSLLGRLLAKIQELLTDFSLSAGGYVDSKGSFKRVEFTLLGQSALNRFEKELNEWKRLFFDLVFALVLANGRTIPEALQRNKPLTPLIAMIQGLFIPVAANPSVLLPGDEVDFDGCEHIQYTAVSYHSHPSGFLLEYHNTTATEEQVRDIAVVLRSADPSLVNILRCRGFRNKTLKFDVPIEYLAPLSLRKVLLGERDDKDHSSKPQHALDHRLTLMKQLASAVLFVHTADLVHKSIRADNIVLFRHRDEANSAQYSHARTESLGQPFLLGFDLSRKAAASSERGKTTDFHKAYYLAPDRQGDTNRKYSMLDDVYSLGVLFLELALWRSFVIPHRRQNEEYTFERDAVLMDGVGVSAKPLQPEPLRKRFIGLAKKEAARSMGSTIAALIVACLSCLSDPEAFGNKEELQDKDGIVAGMAYIKRVILALDRVAM